MVIIFETKNIDEVAYTKIIRRYVSLMESSIFWKDFEKLAVIRIIPIEDSETYREFYGHVTRVTSLGMAWGITMPKSTHSELTILCFVKDVRNPMYLRSNARIVMHELAHGIRSITHKGKRMKRTCQHPEGREGSSGSAHTVLVHNVYYCTKKQFRFWIRYKFIWLPVSGINIR